jgi:hypothetical protein
MIAQALREGARTGPELRQKLAQLRDFKGIQGSLAFDSDGEVNLGAVLLQVEGGKVQRLGG